MADYKESEAMWWEVPEALNVGSRWAITVRRAGLRAGFLSCFNIRRIHNTGRLISFNLKYLF